MWLTVVMYLRFSQRANADGTVVWYVALAHNRRVDGKVKPDVLLRLAASIRKHFGDGGGLGDGAEAGLAAGAAPMEVIDARPIGTAWLLDALWPSWRSAPRSSGSLMADGSPRRWSGCCSPWSVTGRSSR